MPKEALVEKMQVSTCSKVCATGGRCFTELELRFDIIAWLVSLSEPQTRVFVETSSDMICAASQWFTKKDFFGKTQTIPAVSNHTTVQTAAHGAQIQLCGLYNQCQEQNLQYYRDDDLVRLGAHVEINSSYLATRHGRLQVGPWPNKAFSSLPVRVVWKNCKMVNW